MVRFAVTGKEREIIRTMHSARLPVYTLSDRTARDRAMTPSLLAGARDCGKRTELG
jgi:hypothetical protein